MDTIVRPPVAVSEPPPTRRRWLRRVVISTIAAGLCFLVFSGVFLARYQPLDARSTGIYSVRAPGLTIESFEAYPADGDLTQYQVEWRTGAKLRVVFRLWNYGPFSVTVRGLGEPESRTDGNATFRLLGTGPMSGPEAGSVTRRWFPIRLAPGEGIQVHLEITLRRDVAVGSGVIVNTIGLRYRTWWVEQEVSLPLRQSIYVCRGPTCFE